jgi:hypothetical protein
MIASEFLAVQTTHPCKLIPLCGWCQQDSAARLRRMTALLTRLTEALRP